MEALITNFLNALIPKNNPNKSICCIWERKNQKLSLINKNSPVT